MVAAADGNAFDVFANGAEGGAMPPSRRTTVGESDCAGTPLLPSRLLWLVLVLTRCLHVYHHNTLRRQTAGAASTAQCQGACSTGS